MQERRKATGNLECYFVVLWVYMEVISAKVLVRVRRR